MHISGQGPAYLAQIAANGLPGGFRNIGNMEAIELAMSTNEIEDTESQSGKRAVVARVLTSQSLELRLNFKEFNKENFALFFGGTLVNISGSSVTGEIGHASGLVAGDIIRTKFAKISDVVVKDSAGSPATLVLDTDYEIVDADQGLIRILSVSGDTQPYKIDYDYAAQHFITALTGLDKFYYFYHQGINTVDSSKYRTEVYKVKFTPAEVLAILNNEFGRGQLTGKAYEFADAADADANFGQFARVQNPLPV